MASTHRTEHDSLGDIQVPGNALWGAQTQRAIDNFPLSGWPLPEHVHRELVIVRSGGHRLCSGLDGFGFLQSQGS